MKLLNELIFIVYTMTHKRYSKFVMKLLNDLIFIVYTMTLSVTKRFFNEVT